MTKHSVTLGGVQYPLATFTIRDVMTLVPMLVESNQAPRNMKEIERQTQIVHGEIQRGGGFVGDYQQFLALENVTALDLSVAHKKIGQVIGYYLPDTEENPPGEATGAPASP